MSTYRRTASPSQHVRPQGFCCDWPDGLELSRISRIQTLLQTTSSACWKRFCFQRTSAISTLDVLRRCALQIYILLTYLRTDLYAVHTASLTCRSLLCPWARSISLSCCSCFISASLTSSSTTHNQHTPVVSHQLHKIQLILFHECDN